jgi:hypothetical protein
MSLFMLLLHGIGQCPLLESYCDLSDSTHVCCVLQGDTRPEQPTLDHILAQTLAAEMQGHGGCPQMSLSRTQTLFLYLLPCEGMYDLNYIAGNHHVLCDGKGALSKTISKPTGTCNQSVFTVTHALFDDVASTFFQGGVTVQSTNDVNYADDRIMDRPMIQRASGSFGRDGTCNVVNNGINDVTLAHLELNNEECVDSEIPASDLNDALQNYGPDQMSLVRNTNIFESSNSIKPINFNLSDVTLLTSERYRRAYPGRALIDVDNVRSTTWPPKPVMVDGAYFKNLMDLHGFDKTGPLYIYPYYNDTNGTLVFNATAMSENKINSRPLDMVLWDFQGKITFDVFPKDHMFTVVVFADRDLHSINFQENDVVSAYGIDTTTKTGLTLLDSGDFYGKSVQVVLYFFARC